MAFPFVGLSASSAATPPVAAVVVPPGFCCWRGCCLGTVSAAGGRRAIASAAAGAEASAAPPAMATADFDASSVDGEFAAPPPPPPPPPPPVFTRNRPFCFVQGCCTLACCSDGGWVVWAEEGDGATTTAAEILCSFPPSIAEAVPDSVVSPAEGGTPVAALAFGDFSTSSCRPDDAEGGTAAFFTTNRPFLTVETGCGIASVSLASFFVAAD